MSATGRRTTHPPRTLADPLLHVAGAHQRAYATATTIAREEAIARCVGAQVTRTGAPVVGIDENVRQVDPAERAALARLRSGDVDTAVAWYADAGRIAVSSDPGHGPGRHGGRLGRRRGRRWE